MGWHPLLFVLPNDKLYVSSVNRLWGRAKGASFFNKLTTEILKILLSLFRETFSRIWHLSI